MNKLKTVFLGTPAIAAEILEYIYTNKLCILNGVWTGTNKKSGRGQEIKCCPVKEKAGRYNLPVYQFIDPNSNDSISALKKINPDIIFIVSYGDILVKDFFSIPKYGSFNLHFSILPKYRGASPVQSAILNGEVKTGITIQKIAQKMDAGEISLQTDFNIKDMYQNEVFNQAVKESMNIIKKFFENIPVTLTQLKKQNVSDASYCTKLSKELGLIAITDTPIICYNKLRAYNPWPGYYFYINNAKYNITKGSVTSEQNTKTPGTLEKLGKKKLVLWIKNGGIEIIRIKQQGKKEMDTISFLNGCRMDFPNKIS